jgi:hypothetical protein
MLARVLDWLAKLRALATGQQPGEHLDSRAVPGIEASPGPLTAMSEEASMHEETQHDPDAEREAREREELKREHDEEGDRDSAVDEPDEARDEELEPGS